MFGKITRIEYEMYKQQSLCCLKVMCSTEIIVVIKYYSFIFLSLSSLISMGCLLASPFLSNIATSRTFWISWFFDRITTWLFSVCRIPGSQATVSGVLLSTTKIRTKKICGLKALSWGVKLTKTAPNPASIAVVLSNIFPN